MSFVSSSTGTKRLQVELIEHLLDALAIALEVCLLPDQASVTAGLR
jgi:hypothetical protein